MHSSYSSPRVGGAGTLAGAHVGIGPSAEFVKAFLIHLDKGTHLGTLVLLPEGVSDAGEDSDFKVLPRTALGEHLAQKHGGKVVDRTDDVCGQAVVDV